MPLDDYQLEDRYRLNKDRVYLTGTQALVRIALMQKAMDEREGLDTQGFITGYRGSPLGAYDQALWQAQKSLDAANIEFMPAVNEDLAATAVLGTQQVEGDPAAETQGVFSIWYGKGPGVDRAGDALRHGNGYGSSPHGGVLVVAGDDHGCVSSSMSHQSDVAFMTWFMPTLHPANIQEYDEFGLFGFALSRFSGTWVGFKAISETVEGTASVEVTDLPKFNIPTDFTSPPEGLHYRWPDFPGPQIEARMVAKIAAIKAFARANPIDKTLYGIDQARYGFVTTGKAHLDLMEALALLGLDDHRCREIGIDIYKVGMVWPIETEGLRHFLANKHEVLVVEEKRGIVESQLKEFLYDYEGDKPHLMVGKYDEAGKPLIPWVGELNPSALIPLIANRLARIFPDLNLRSKAELPSFCPISSPTDITRRPYFCSGCPHNTSTKLPTGSQALAGIGCHFMATWMDRDTDSLIQMGGEGVNWVAKSKFTNHGHIFQNLGEGTYFHSGSMAIRQAIAANANITYKILYNDAVAMTGGQPVDGPISVTSIAYQSWVEGAKKIVVVAENLAPYKDNTQLPPGTDVYHRDDLDTVQRELREIEGVTILIYDQACAYEKRRRIKRGEMAPPQKRIVINDAVCEGCGDCSKQSNCLSVVPINTPLGRKRTIDQFSCNTDYSCIKGFCPSFVSVIGGTLRKPEASSLSFEMDSIPYPVIQPIDRVTDILICGVGGTGVVTVGALITMAAHLEGKGGSVLDFMGFAQKGGAVLSYVRIGNKPKDVNQVRTDSHRCNTVIVCDLIVATSDKALQAYGTNATKVVVNRAEIPTADFVLHRDAALDEKARLEILATSTNRDSIPSIDANRLAATTLGNSIYSNILMLGFAWQQGLVPVSLEAILRAIELNGVAIEDNKRAFSVGRYAAHNPEFESQVIEPPIALPSSLDALIEDRFTRLVEYQDKRYAERFATLVASVQTREQNIAITPSGLTDAVARNYFKLLAYKDEYEVARLHSNGALLKKIAEQFEGNYKLEFHLAPPLISRKKDTQGRPKKITFGPWMMTAFRALAKMKATRNTWLDPFRWTQDRKLEQVLIAGYEDDIKLIDEHLSATNMQTAIELANLPQEIRGYGPVKEAAVAGCQITRAKLRLQLQNSSLYKDVA